jgi:CheY-like chemotaxis protein
MNENETLLVVEDNEDDVYFMRRALKAAAPARPVRFVCDGRAALDYLHGTGEFADRKENPFPAIVFLDLKLPFVHGLEVLATIRREPALRGLRVFVLTSSSEERDRSQAEQLGVQGYLVKPPTRDMLAPILGSPQAAVATR